MVRKTQWLAASLFVIGVVALGGSWTWWCAERLTRAKAQSPANLQTIYAALRQYAHEAHDRFPDLAMGTRGLAPGPETIYPQYLKDPSAFISPAFPDKVQLRTQAADDPKSVMDDRSYWYLGYTMQDERTGLSFVDAYRESVRQGTQVPEVRTWWDQEAGRAWEEQFRQWQEEERVTGGERPALGPPHSAPPQAPPENIRWHLREGIARFLITDINQPVGVKVLPPSPFPIMIERPSLFGDGGHVLYLDGRVEWIPYPGPFPMTEKFIQALESLDEVRTQPNGEE